MSRMRLLAVLTLAAALVTAPVVSPINAVATPVTPVLKSRPLAGVDAPSLALSPQAFDPQALSSAGANAPAQAGRAARTSLPAVLTGELDTGHFAAAGVTWSRQNAPSNIVVQVRVREAGAWSEWYPLEQEGGPDPTTHEGQRSAMSASAGPIAAAHGDGIQVRVDTASRATPSKLALVTVDPGTSAADANLTGLPSSSAHAGAVSPAIITRAQWGADEGLRPADCSPEYSTTIRAGFVHHTVNTNTYAPSESPGLVRAIYAFHVNGNGWCDIGYNFLVDRFGVAFEGRFGGMDRPVIGAHAGGFNTATFAVAGIGDFTSSQPAPAMTDTIASILGWKLGLHNRDPRGSTVLISAGGPYTAYPAGTAVPVRVVSGHRDVNRTGCPGDTLYPLLDSISARAATYKGQQSSTTQDLYGIWGTTIWPPSGRVEIHAQSASSGWFYRMTDVATQWASGRPDDWRFFVGSFSGDTRPDLIAVHANNTNSGYVEITVASWASYYQDTIVSTITPARSFKPDVLSQLSVGGPSGGDVYIVNIQGTASGRVELHALSSASKYANWALNTTTGLYSGYNTSQNRFLVAKGSGDLYYVAHGWTGTGRSEVWALSANSGYTRYIWGAATPIGYTSDTNSQWVMGVGSIPDLFWVQSSATGTGKVELHGLSPWTQYGQWFQHTASSLPGLAPPGWQFGMG